MTQLGQLEFNWTQTGNKGKPRVWPPPRMPVANEGLWGFPTKNAIILVVTVTGRGPYPRETMKPIFNLVYEVHFCLVLGHA